MFHVKPQNKMQLVNIKEVKSNPKNPRIIKDGKFQKLVKSIQDFPDMLNKRPLVVFTDVDGKYVVLGGNMRLKALKELKYESVPVIVADEWTEEQKHEFLIKDNVGFGEWDWDSLANEWDVEKLDDWGLQIYGFEDNMTNNEDYEGLDQLSKLDKFMATELKRMFLVYENKTFERVVKWFEEKQAKYNCEDNSELILKLMENENI